MARFWRPGAFDASAALRALGFDNPDSESSAQLNAQLPPTPVSASFGRRRRRAWVAAAASAAALIAAATFYFAGRPETTEVPAPQPVVVQPTVPAEAVSARIEFTDASLTTVVKQIEKTYGVRITNVPEGDYRLTLSYEGTAADLVATINDILSIHLTIEQ